MPDDNDFDFEIPDGDGPVSMGRNDLKQLREAAKRGSKAERLERENAMLKAGINTDDDRLAFFANGYDGELDPETIKAEATRLGFLGAPAPVTETIPTPTTAQEPSAPAPEPTPDLADISSVHDAAAAAGRTPAANELPQPDPYQRSAEIYETAMQDGAKKDEAGGLAFASVIAAAQQGDNRVILKQPGSAHTPATAPQDGELRNV